MNSSHDTPPTLIAVAAMSNNRVIGNKGKLPWNLPEDLKFFKKLTTGHPVVMGRKTYESIGRPLPNRENIILSKTMDRPLPGTVLYNSIKDFTCGIKDHHGPVFIIGGSQIYSTLIHLTQEIFLTFVYKDYDGDAKFPSFESEFRFNKNELITDQFEIRHYVRS